MVVEVRMPRLEEDMEEGTINGWLRSEGESVAAGDPLLEIETSKVNLEIESPASGILRRILAKKGELVPINTVIAVIADATEDLGAYSGGEKDVAAPKGGAKESREPEPDAPRPAADALRDRVPVSPIARKLAAERSLDLSLVAGTGPGGRITRDDVLNFRPAASGEPTGRRVRERLPFTGMRRSIGNRMSESWRTIPRAENHVAVDVTQLVKLRETMKEVWEERHGVRPSVNDFIVAAAARALRQHPLLNSTLNEADGTVDLYEDINISIAVAAETGLVTPVVRNADRRDLFDIARESRRLAELVRLGRHSSQALADSTFTITNLGMFGIDFFVPVVNPPEAAILAVGKIDRKPVVIGDGIAIRSMLNLCVAYDHRIVDGVVAARFLQSAREWLEAPMSSVDGDRTAM